MGAERRGAHVALGISFAFLGLVAASLAGLTLVAPDPFVTAPWIRSYGVLPLMVTSLILLILSLGVFLLSRAMSPQAVTRLTRAGWGLIAALLTLILFTPPSCSIGIADGFGQVPTPPPDVQCKALVGVTLTPESPASLWFAIYSYGLPIAVGVGAYIGLVAIGKKTAKS